jgi:multidrug efflux pump subunit AcrA (membrane-fusion protein)
MSDLTPMDPDVADDMMALVAQVEDLSVIGSDADFARASDLLMAAVTLRDRIEAWFKPLLDAQADALKVLRARRTEELKNIVFVEARLRPALAAYTQAAMERRRQAEQAALEEARRVAEAAKAAQIAQAADAAAAQAIQDRPTILLVPRPTIPAPLTVPGIGARDTWSAKVTNFQDLIVAASLHPNLYAQFLLPNQAALNEQARRMKERLNVPGVEPLRTTSTTVSRKS